MEVMQKPKRKTKQKERVREPDPEPEVEIVEEEKQEVVSNVVKEEPQRQLVVEEKDEEPVQGYTYGGLHALLGKQEENYELEAPSAPLNIYPSLHHDFISENKEQEQPYEPQEQEQEQQQQKQQEYHQEQQQQAQQEHPEVQQEQSQQELLELENQDVMQPDLQQSLEIQEKPQENQQEKQQEKQEKQEQQFSEQTRPASAPPIHENTIVYSSPQLQRKAQETSSSPAQATRQAHPTTIAKEGSFKNSARTAVVEPPPTYSYATSLAYASMFTNVTSVNIPATIAPATTIIPAYAHPIQETKTEEPIFFQPLKVESEFFNMLKKYYLFQKQLDAVEPHAQELRYRCQNAQVWQFVEHTRTLELQCRDRNQITHTFSWKVGIMDQNIYSQLRKDLDDLRALCGESLTDKLFESQLSKLLVEVYIDDFLWHSKFGDRFKLDSTDAPTEPLFESNHNGEVAKLEHMVEVLFCFAFCFKNSKLFPPNCRHLELFCDDIKKWIQKLCGVYLQVSSQMDDVRVLRHVLACPGIGEWGSHVVYFDDSWNYQQAEHFLYMLSIFLFPLPLFPSLFLSDFDDSFENIRPLSLSKNIPPPPELNSIEDDFQVVSSPTSPAPILNGTKALLLEEDYVSVLEQFPFFSFFKFIFEVRDFYTPQDTAHSFETAKRIVDVLAAALSDFSHFSHFSKMLAASIVRALSFANIYYQHRKENLNDKSPDLDHHYYNLFCNVVSILVIKGSRNGLWQFLGNLPYSSLQGTASLSILSILIGRKLNEHITSKRQWDDMLANDKSVLDSFGSMLMDHEGSEYPKKTFYY